MPIFTAFSDLLPDPNNKIDTAGVAVTDTSGSAGPGFASVKFRSNRQVQVSRTISGRGITASPGYHVWEFDINYNPLTRAEFEPVATFIETREGRLRPFFVILPQHNKPQDSTFYNYCLPSVNNGVNGTENVASRVTAAQTPAGSTSIMITCVTEGVAGSAGNPKPGDFINIVDTNDVNHVKAYKITRVETSTNYRSGTTPPTGTQRRIHVTPALARNVASGAGVRFINTKFRVIQKGDTLEYDLNTDNLYQFSLSLEEILP